MPEPPKRYEAPAAMAPSVKRKASPPKGEVSRSVKPRGMVAVFATPRPRSPKREPLAPSPTPSFSATLPFRGPSPYATLRAGHHGPHPPNLPPPGLPRHGSPNPPGGPFVPSFDVSQRPSYKDAMNDPFHPANVRPTPAPLKLAYRLGASLSKPPNDPIFRQAIQEVINASATSSALREYMGNSFLDHLHHDNADVNQIVAARSILDEEILHKLIWVTVERTHTAEHAAGLLSAFSRAVEAIHGPTVQHNLAATDTDQAPNDVEPTAPGGSTNDAHNSEGHDVEEKPPRGTLGTLVPNGQSAEDDPRRGLTWMSDPEALDSLTPNELKEVFFYARDLYSYYALPAIQKELGGRAPDPDSIKLKIFTSWNEMEASVKLDWITIHRTFMCGRIGTHRYLDRKWMIDRVGQAQPPDPASFRISRPASAENTPRLERERMAALQQTLRVSEHPVTELLCGRSDDYSCSLVLQALKQESKSSEDPSLEKRLETLKSQLNKAEKPGQIESLLQDWVLKNPSEFPECHDCSFIISGFDQDEPQFVTELMHGLKLTRTNKHEFVVQLVRTLRDRELPRIFGGSYDQHVNGRWYDIQGQGLEEELKALAALQSKHYTPQRIVSRLENILRPFIFANQIRFPDMARTGAVKAWQKMTGFEW